jgi:hypothetical protein
MIASPLYRSSTTSLSRPSTRARENSNDEFQTLDRYAGHGTDRFDVFLLVMTSDDNRQVVLGCFGLNLETVLA